ncbi:hypothetical protein [Campylobacter sp. P0109]|uniref:hypothetical protein n=1 Tax=Campylobacter sp. P0109 TaxID=1895606 RepID=UPI000A333FF3|nr:hypothetical protein [Campylobacter sp. P0109]
MKEYISGWEALNIPNEKGLVADWHPLCFLSNKDDIKKYKYNEILGNKGIKKHFIPMLNRDEYVASFARAIADLVYMKEFTGLKNCVRDYLDDEDEKELFGYLKSINFDKEVDYFMKYELTKLYFADKEQ